MFSSIDHEVILQYTVLRFATADVIASSSKVIRCNTFDAHYSTDCFADAARVR